MRISDWSSDVCSSDLATMSLWHNQPGQSHLGERSLGLRADCACAFGDVPDLIQRAEFAQQARHAFRQHLLFLRKSEVHHCRSDEHTSELQSLMRISYAVFCLNTKQNTTTHHTTIYYIYIIHQHSQ